MNQISRWRQIFINNERDPEEDQADLYDGEMELMPADDSEDDQNPVP